MPYWRGIFVVAVALSTSGCLFSAYQIASMTATGVSYVFSGRSMGDHALSLAMDKDCATLRLFEGEEICVDFDPEYDNSWDALAATWEVPELKDGSVAPVPPVDSEFETLLAEAIPEDNIADVAPDVDRNEAVLFAIDIPLEAEPERAQPETSVLAVASVVDETVAGAGMPANTDPPGLDLDALLPASGPSPGAATASTVANLLEKQIFSDPATEPQIIALDTAPGVFLVIGSFRDNSNAQTLVAAHREMNTAIQTLQSGGRNMYRVVAGPIHERDIGSARSSFARAGIRHTWAVRLCRGNLSLPPCIEPAVQQAQLPSR